MHVEFDSFADFLAMGGYGVFVWSVYGITTVVLVALVLAPLRKSRRFWIDQAMRIKRERISEQRHKS